MNTTITNYDEAENLANQLKTQASDMQGILDNISNLLSSNLGNPEVWDGDTANQVKEKFRALYDQFHTFSDAVNESGNYVLKAVDNYRQAENAMNNASQNFNF